MPGEQCLNEIHGVKFVVEGMGLCFLLTSGYTRPNNARALQISLNFIRSWLYKRLKEFKSIEFLSKQTKILRS